MRSAVASSSKIAKAIREQDQQSATLLPGRAQLNLTSQFTRLTGLGGLQRGQHRAEVRGMLFGRYESRLVIHARPSVRPNRVDVSNRRARHAAARLA